MVCCDNEMRGDQGTSVPESIAITPCTNIHLTRNPGPRTPDSPRPQDQTPIVTTSHAATAAQLAGMMPQGARSKPVSGQNIRRDDNKKKGPILCICDDPQAPAAWRTIKHLEGVPGADVQCGGVEWGRRLSGRAATGLKVKQRGGRDKRAAMTPRAQWRPGPETTLPFVSDEAAACR